MTTLAAAGASGMVSQAQQMPAATGTDWPQWRGVYRDELATAPHGQAIDRPADQHREGENASMLGSRSWLLASTTDGNLVVAHANPQKYEEVRRYQIAESALWAHPAITGSSIIVKDVDKVICWSF